MREKKRTSDNGTRRLVMPLRQRIKALEEENAELRESLATAAADRDAYLKSLYGFLKQGVTEKDLLEFERSIREDEWIPFERALAKIEEPRVKDSTVP